MTGPDEKMGLIALGANLPIGQDGPEVTLGHAAAQLADVAKIQASSRLFATPAFPAGSGPDYVNAAICVRTTLDARALLAALHGIEERLGRQRAQRWGARVVDLDLLALGDQVCPDLGTYSKWQRLPLDQQVNATPDQLILPHPRMQDRAFVLVPLAEICPDWRHPVLDLTVRQMRDGLNPADIAAVRPLNPGD